MTQIQMRRGTAASAAGSNPTLAEGELGYETDTGRGKMGDGETAWNALPYLDRHVLAAVIAHAQATTGVHGIADTSALETQAGAQAKAAAAGAAAALASIPRALVDAKGDLLVGAGDDAPTRLAAGSKGALLVPDPAAASGLRWLTGTPGDTLTYTAADGWSISPVRHLTGEGFPTMDAPVRSIYTDRAATNGAVMWRKIAPGTGVDKWRCVEGDTGWRNISSLLNASYVISSVAGEARLRRIGDVVYARFKLDVVADPAQNLLTSLPTGFRPTGLAQGYNAIPVAPTAGAGASNFSGTRVAYLSTDGNGWAFGWSVRPPNPGTVAWTPTPHVTGDAWPTTLPGTAA